MHRIDTATAVADVNGTGKTGFVDGTPPAAVAPTRLNADWFNAAQEEIANTIEGFGGTLNTAAADRGGGATQLLAVFGRLKAAQNFGAIMNPAAIATGGAFEYRDFAASYGGLGGKPTSTSTIQPGILAVGTGGGLSYSNDLGRTWSTLTPAASYAGTFHCAVWFNNLFVFAGTLGEIQTWAGVSTASHRTPASSYADTFMDVACTATICVLAGQTGVLQWSTNGAAWNDATSAPANATACNAVATDGANFVACGAASSGDGMWISPDGKSWTQVAAGGLNTWVDVCYSAALRAWFACTSNGHIYRSLDGGATWASVLGGYAATRFNSIVALDFGVAAFSDDTGASGLDVVTACADGVTWINLGAALGKTAAVRNVRYVDDSFTGCVLGGDVGTNGSIVRSQFWSRIV